MAWRELVRENAYEGEGEVVIMYNVMLFFVPWNTPEDIIEFSTERCDLDEIDVYGVPMVEAAEKVKNDLPLDTTFNMLRCVKHGDEVLEMENVCVSTGRKPEDSIVLENLQGVKKVLDVIGKVAGSLEVLENL